MTPHGKAPGDWLRAGMERCTEDVRLPGAAIEHAVRRYRRRMRRRRYAVTAAGLTAAAAAVLAVSVSATSGGIPRVSAPRTTTIAYITQRTEQSLTARAMNSIVETTTRAGAGAPGWVSWTDQSGGRSKTRWFGPGGRVLREAAQVAGGGRVQITTVNYTTRTWSRTAYPAGDSARDGQDLGGLPDSAAAIRAALASGTLSMRGRQEIAGVTAIVVSVTALHSPGRKAIEMWLDPDTYLPVRVAIINPGTRPGAVENLRWLEATPDNLRQLAVTVPAGFTRGGAG